MWKLLFAIAVLSFYAAGMLMSEPDPSGSSEVITLFSLVGVLASVTASVAKQGGFR